MPIINYGKRKNFFYFLALLNFINISNLFAEDYYWVAGSGNWSELNHWATSSGGTVFHSSVPGFDDNVIFDGNSFSDVNNSVIVNVESATCANLDFSGLTKNLSFTGSTELHIHATLILDPFVNFGFDGNLVFEAEYGDHTIFTENNNFKCNIVFAGLYTNWTINGDLDCNKSLYLTTPGGTFDFGHTNINESFEISSYSSNVNVLGTLNVNGDFILNGSASTFRNSEAMQVGDNFFIIGSGSEISLGGNLSVAKFLLVSDGNFITNEYDVSAANLTLSLGSSVDLSGSDISIAKNFLIQGSGLTLTSSSSSLYFTGGNAIFQSDVPVNFNLIRYNLSGQINCSNSTVQNLTFLSNGIINGNQNNFVSATFSRNGNVNGNHQYNVLNLSAGYEYEFEANSLQTIVNSLNASGNCGAYIVFKSSLEDTQANISKSSGTINLDYAIVKDINFTGGANFLSAAYVDIQNTSGLAGSLLSGRSLYWVGGTGSWNDPAHWSAVSGGAGGECIPSPVDDVIFDGNSFLASLQEVVADKEQSFCRNIDWTSVTNNPVFSNILSNAELNVFGSIRLNALMNNNFDGSIIFRSKNIGNEIQSNGNSFSADILFEGKGGEWTLSDDINLNDKSIYLNKGTFSSAGNNLYLNEFYSNEDIYNRNLNIEGSELFLSGNWYVAGEQFGLSAAGSHVYMEKKDAQMESGNNLIYNNISFTAGDSFSAELNGAQLTINQLGFASNGQLNNANSTVQNLVIDGDGILNGENNLFQNAEFKSNGLFLFDNSFGILTLTPTGTYTFKNGKTQTINTELNANGNCNAPVTLLSDVEGSNAYLAKLNTDLVVDYVTMRDIEAVAGVNYTANNVTDLGNNTGWTINAVTPKDYYWVGDAGNWEDVNNWAFTSGGLGGAIGACLPTQNDNVIFDQNSFSADGQVVTVNSEIVNCKTMDWSAVDNQAVIQNAGNSDLNVHGAFILSQNLSWNYAGQVFFKGVGDVFTVNTEDNVLLDDVFFDGNGATWQILSNFSTNMGINLIQGAIIADDITLRASGFLSHTDYPSGLQANNSLIFIANEWNTDLDFSYEGINTKLVFSGYNSSFSYNSIHNVNIHEIEMQGLSSAFLANRASVSVLDMNGGSINGTNSAIDSLYFKDEAQVFGNLTIENGDFASSTEIFQSHNFGNVNFYGLTKIYMDNFFGTAYFHGDADINSNNEFDSLIFSPNHTYTLGIYRTQTINNYLGLKGNNCFKIDIRTNTEGVGSIISFVNGIVEGYALNLKGINVTGGGEFYAAGPSSDLGGNTGWVFRDPPGYIYGFNADSIYLHGETAQISTNNFNTDINTQFLWNTGSIEPFIETTEAGKFVVDVIYNTEPNQCSFTDEVNIYFADVKNPTCRTFTDGQIEIKADSGESYNYLWSNGSTDPIISNLSAGEYSLEITDNSTGEKANRIFNLVEPDTLKPVFSEIKQISCTGLNDGELGLSISGGNNPYSIVWKDDAGISGMTHSMLQAGIYEVQVSDSASCESVTVSAEIVDPGELSMDIAKVQGISCSGESDAKLSYNATGGTEPYSCEWSTGVTADTIYNLSVGEYSVILTDANNCAVLFDTISIDNPQSLDYSYTVKDQLCPGTNSGSIGVFVSGGTEPYFYQWEHTDVNYARLDSLLPGVYNVNITDAFNCGTIIQTFEIKEGKKIILENISMEEPKCYNENTGKISFSPNGGYGNLQYSLDSNAFQSNTYFEDLKGGGHILTVKDDSLCEQEFNLNLSQPDFLEATYDVTNPSCLNSSDGIIEFDPIGGSLPYSFSWINPEGVEQTELDQLSVGQYVLRLSDKNMCSFIDTVSLNALECEPYINVPNVFSPNNDGTNDVFSLEMYNISNFRLDIYSRWGGHLSTMDNSRDYWDGTINNSNREAPAGVYYYNIVATTLDGEIITKKGTVHLFR
ncbi:MAG: gliding motility-associated C-terminal domain-containing protein [Bacteroidota bacterium]